MKYSISIDHEHKLIRYRHRGLIFAGDIEKAWFDFLAYKEFTELGYNLFSDYRNGKFEIPLDFLPEIIVFMKKIESVVRGKKQALLVDEPYSVAASMLFENEVNKEVGFNVQVFSTEIAALEWLGS
ncbi:MAG: hypothetical protein V2I37_10935 [Marinilabiliaceae bacterium]|jgi:hypothetical protein|nr:hypothetical protein [Marinilabiliaceae bacterium]